MIQCVIQDVSQGEHRLLNLGCGGHCHPNWVNVDLVAQAPGVVEYDLRCGVPFGDETFDAVYHSHILEHLSPNDGRKLLGDCYRVLRPGGVLRVAVPDLEGIVREYLRLLDAVDRDEGFASAENTERSTEAESQLTWMRLELMDQMTRIQSGGEMMQFIRDAGGNQSLNNGVASFLESRIGEEFKGIVNCKGTLEPLRKKRRLRARCKKHLRRLRLALAKVLVWVVAGNHGRQALGEGLFRQSGEVHRWMYDRQSLSALLHEVGFESISMKSAHCSSIPSFSDYQLDAVNGQVRKPDSLFMEGMKPRRALS